MQRKRIAAKVIDPRHAAARLIVFLPLLLALVAACGNGSGGAAY